MKQSEPLKVGFEVLEVDGVPSDLPVRLRFPNGSLTRTQSNELSVQLGGVGIESDPIVAAINGIVKSNGTTIGAVVSGTDIKTVNSTSILGSGDVSIVDTLTTSTPTNLTGFIKGNGSVLSADNTSYLPIGGGTLTGNLLFTDATYDIGASGATRPRALYLSGLITAAPDTDTLFTFGRVKIGYTGASDYAVFCHYDLGQTANYALMQYYTGATFINASSSQAISFLINNSTTIATLAIAGLTMTAALKIQLRDTAIYLGSSVDGTLDIVADTILNLGSTVTTLNIGNTSVTTANIATGASVTNVGAAGNIVLGSSGYQVGFYGSAGAVKSSAYTKNATVVIDRTLLASASATVTNNNNVLAALISDLQSIGLIA